MAASVEHVVCHLGGRPERDVSEDYGTHLQAIVQAGSPDVHAPRDLVETTRLDVAAGAWAPAHPHRGLASARLAY